MARTLNFDEMTELRTNVKDTLVSAFCKEGETFSDETITAIIEAGLKQTARIKLTMPALAQKFIRLYMENHSIPDLKIEEVHEVEIREVPTEVDGATIENLTKAIKAQVLQELENQMPKETIQINVNGLVKKITGKVHEKFKTVCAYVANDEPVYLAGPAGCGKNHLCEQVAEALGLDFYFTNAVTQEYKLIGFVDAMGTYQETPFYKAFTNGGLFMLDEIDASIPEALIILNAAIANREMVFPNSAEIVHAHPNFRVVAAGNTVGTGATFEYNGRSQLDGASLNRFGMVIMDYSRDVELSCCGGDREFVNFIHDLRKASKSVGRFMIISYRDISRVYKMRDSIGLEEAIRTGIVKGLDKTDLASMVNQMDSSNIYTQILAKI